MKFDRLYPLISSTLKMECKGTPGTAAGGKPLIEELETDWNRAVLGDAVEYCTSAEFTSEINRFRSKYASNFGAKNKDAKSLAVGEHSLEDTIIFDKYQKLVESMLQSFVTSKGSTISDFFSECRAAMENKFCALFEEHEHHWFVEMLLDWLDFDHFCDSMAQFDGDKAQGDESKCCGDDNDEIADSKCGHK